MAVYFVRAGSFIKIGYADNPARRIKELQTGSPHKLEVIGVMPGDASREREIHEIFRDFRVNGEWFELVTDILAYITQNGGEKPEPTSPKKRVVLSESPKMGDGWIEYPKKGTRNPKRYAYQRYWVIKGGKWVKSAPVRIKSIPPMSEEEYLASQKETS